MVALEDERSGRHGELQRRHEPPPSRHPFSRLNGSGAFLRSVYGWMCAGLPSTALVAVFVASSPSLVRRLRQNRLVFWGLVIARIGSSSCCVSARGSPRPGHGFVVVHRVFGAHRGDHSRSCCSRSRVNPIATTFLVRARDVRRHGALWHVHQSQPGGIGSVSVHGLIDVVLASISRNVLAQRRTQFVISLHRRHRVYRFGRDRCSTLQRRWRWRCLWGQSWLVRGRRCVVAYTSTSSICSLFLLRFLGGRRE